jgi:acetylglutamate kinase
VELVVIKIGGKITSDLANLEQMSQEIKTYTTAGHYRFILIHGGGNEVTELTKKLGMEPVFVNGVRMTSSAEMDIVDMVLAGKINKQLVRFFQARGVNAIGLSGSDGRLFTGCKLNPQTHTGEITNVKKELLHLLVAEGYFPVIASTAMEENGQGLNINADAVAFALASELAAHTLLFISDIPGVLKGGAVLASIKQATVAEEIRNGVVTGGMIPKVQASVQALTRGVKQIVIGNYLASGHLRRLIQGEQGTVIQA